MTYKTEKSGSPMATYLQLSDLKTEPEDFQFRAYEFAEHHVQDLVSAIKAGCDIDPLTVWQRDENDYVIVNGHHRYEAFQRCKFKGSIPVTIHKCDEGQAKLLALAESAKTKLPMTNTEKSDAAWQLVCSKYGYSKSEICRATGVSNGTVAKMRRHLKLFIEEETEIPESWWMAMRTAKQTTETEWDDEMKAQMIEAAARELDDKIGNTLARAGRKWPEAVDLVLERRLSKLSLSYVIDEFSQDDTDLDDLPF